MRLPLLPPLMLGLLCACASVPRALGPDAPAARRASDDLLSALAARFGPASPGPRFRALRPRLARAGLAPSRVFDDPDVWTRSDGPLRELGFRGLRLGSDYRLEVAETPGRPDQASEYGGTLTLERLRPGEFEWRIREELGLGSLTAAGLAAAADAALRIPERLPPGDARDALRGALPRTAAALGRAFSLELLAVSAPRAGGRRVDAEALLHPEWLADELPRYASFLERHVASMRLSLVVSDAGGSPFWEAGFRDKRLRLALRVAEGSLAPLEGSPRGLGDRCVALVEITMKSGLFRVGFEGLRGEVALASRPGSLGFRAAFASEPRWRLPFFVEPLMRGPLRHPFVGVGAQLAYGFNGAGPEGSAVAWRSYRLAVKESWVVRFLGGSVGSTVADFRRGAEAEADRFTRDALLALRDDALALLP